MTVTFYLYFFNFSHINFWKVNLIKLAGEGLTVLDSCLGQSLCPRPLLDFGVGLKSNLQSIGMHHVYLK